MPPMPRPGHEQVSPLPADNPVQPQQAEIPFVRRLADAEYAVEASADAGPVFVRQRRPEAVPPETRQRVGQPAVEAALSPSPSHAEGAPKTPQASEATPPESSEPATPASRHKQPDSAEPAAEAPAAGSGGAGKEPPGPPQPPVPAVPGPGENDPSDASELNQPPGKRDPALDKPATESLLNPGLSSDESKVARSIDSNRGTRSRGPDPLTTPMMQPYYSPAAPKTPVNEVPEGESAGTTIEHVLQVPPEVSFIPDAPDTDLPDSPRTYMATTVGGYVRGHIEEQETDSVEVPTVQVAEVYRPRIVPAYGAQGVESRLITKFAQEAIAEGAEVLGHTTMRLDGLRMMKDTFGAEALELRETRTGQEIPSLYAAGRQLARNQLGGWEDDRYYTPGHTQVTVYVYLTDP
jgi:hypothetical protein